MSVEQELVWLRLMVQMLRENAAIRSAAVANANDWYDLKLV